MRNTTNRMSEFAKEIEEAAAAHPPMPRKKLERLNQSALGRLMKAMNQLRNVIDMMHGDTEEAFIHNPMTDDYEQFKDIRQKLYSSLEGIWKLAGPMVLDTDFVVSAFPDHK